MQILSHIFNLPQFNELTQAHTEGIRYQLNADQMSLWVILFQITNLHFLHSICGAEFASRKPFTMRKRNGEGVFEAKSHISPLL